MKIGTKVRLIGYTSNREEMTGIVVGHGVAYLRRGEECADLMTIVELDELHRGYITADGNGARTAFISTIVVAEGNLEEIIEAREPVTPRGSMPAPDDSPTYRNAMKDAGRGWLLR